MLWVTAAHPVPDLDKDLLQGELHLQVWWPARPCVWRVVCEPQPDAELVARGLPGRTAGGAVADLYCLSLPARRQQHVHFGRLRLIRMRAQVGVRARLSVIHERVRVLVSLPDPLQQL